MSAKQSNLSNFKEYYDVVVALSQASINATMKQYLFESDMPVVTGYYNKDDNENAVAVDFKVGNEDGSQFPDPDVIKNLKEPKKFLCAFKAQIGIPLCFEPDTIPDIIGLIPGNARSVNFKLLWYSFTIAQPNFDGEKIASYLSQFQPDDGAWIFTSNVPLRNVNDATNLPSSVQQQVDSMSGNFSVQKLMLDLGNAGPLMSRHLK